MDLVEKLIFKKMSVWTIACSAHSYACYGYRYDVDGQRIPGRIGLTVREGIDRFVFNEEQVMLVDQVNWPKNEPCAY